ncbi:MAG: hypothetical protein V1682_00420 [Candidatus Omnitrophota bacterium]
MSMKGFYRVALAVLLAGCISPHSYASSVGDNIEPLGNLKVAAGAGSNWVFSKHMRSGGDYVATNVSATRLEIDYNQVWSKIAVGITDYLNVYTKIGTVTKATYRIRTTNGMDGNIKTEPSFMWGLGVAGAYKFGRNKDWMLGADAAFNEWRNRTTSSDTISGAQDKYMNVTGSFDTWEFQLTPYIAKRFDLMNEDLQLKPYMGPVWEMYRMRTNGSIKYTSQLTGLRGETTVKTRERQPLGIVIGIDVTLYKHVTLNVEGRFINETALSLSGSYRF